MTSSKLVILDRDGVINKDSDHYIKSAAEWVPVPGSIEAIANLYKAGFTVAIATNQSGLARDLFDEHVLAEMHEKLHNLVEEQGGNVHGIFICPHHPNDNCNCRKPATGLLEQIKNELDVSLTGAWFIGDSEKDIDCALAMDCQPVLVLTGKGYRTQESLSDEKRNKVSIFENLSTAVHALLNNSDNTGN